MKKRAIFCFYFLVIVAVANSESKSAKKESSEFEGLLSKYVSRQLREDESEFETDDLETLVDVEFYGSGDSSGECTKVRRKNTDDFVDTVFDEVRPKLPEPAKLPGRTGRFRLANGTLFGLGNLKRVGPAMTRCHEDTFSFLVPIGFRHLYGGYSWELGMLERPLKGAIDVTINNVQGDVLYTRNETPDGVKATVEKLEITKLQGVDVSIDGLGPFNFIASRLSNFAARVFRRGLSRMLEGPVREAMNKELENVEKYEKFFLL